MSLSIPAAALNRGAASLRNLSGSRRVVPLGLALVLSSSLTALAGETDRGGRAAPDKGRYHLFYPTPRDQMREMSTDRPDTTESPFTVDAGHYQAELSFFDYNRNHADGVTTETWVFGAINLKAGLFNNVDLQVVFDAFTEERTKAAGTTISESGTSDIIIRLKTNVWGNDGGRTALGIMPFVKIPTETDVSNGEWEGGIIVPFAASLTDRVGLGLMLEADFVHNPDDGGYEIEWVHTGTLAFDFTDQLGLFTEYVGVASAENGFDYRASFNVGVTVGLSDDLVVDAGIRIELNSPAEDFGAFVGMSLRF